MSQTSHAVVAQTFVGDFGQVVSRLRISCPDGDPGLAPADFDIVNGFVNSSETLPCQGVREVHWENGELVLTVDPFLYRTDFSVRGSRQGEPGCLSWRSPGAARERRRTWTLPAE